MNFNCSVPLWQSQRQSDLLKPYLGPVYTVIDGAINDGLQILAVFDNTKDAEQCLADAGFSRFVRSNGIAHQWKTNP